MLIFSLILMILDLGSAVTTTTEIFPSQGNTIYYSLDAAKQLSNGLGDSLIVGATKQATNNIRRGLLKFDIPNTPGTTIIGAQLTLTVRKSGHDDADLMDIFPVTQPWGQGASNATSPGQGAPSEQGDASWLFSFYPTAKWATPGGSFPSIATASQSVGGQGIYNFSSQVFVDILNDFAKNPHRNLGWIFKIRNESITGSAKECVSHNECETDPQSCPHLILTLQSHSTQLQAGLLASVLLTLFVLF